MINLSRLRELRGLNQRQLGEMIGRDQSTIQRAETGHASAKLSTYQACADALGVSLAAIFADDLSPIEMEMIRVFRSVPPAKRDRLVQLMELAADPPAAEEE